MRHLRLNFENSALEISQKYELAATQKFRCHPHVSARENPENPGHAADVSLLPSRCLVFGAPQIICNPRINTFFPLFITIFITSFERYRLKRKYTLAPFHAYCTERLPPAGMRKSADTQCDTLYEIPHNYSITFKSKTRVFAYKG